MGIKLLSDIAEVKDIKLQNAAGAETGRIQSVGNDLVFSNAVGDILIGDGASDVYIGDGTNSVDILFEQSGSIKAEDGSSGVTLTLGSSDTTLALGSSISSATTIIGDFTVGVDDTGYDVKFFGATSGRSMLWDESYDGLILSDNTKLQLGSSTGYGDLQLLHDGSNSYIQNAFGQLYINQNVNDADIVLQCDDGSGGTTAYLTLDGSEARMNAHKDLRFDDDEQLQLGAGADMQMYHNGSTSVITNQTGDILIRNQTDDGDIVFQADDGSGGDANYFKLDGGNGNIRFEKNLFLLDDVKLLIGSGTDLQIYHDGSNSYIKDVGTGSLSLDSNGTQINLGGGGENFAIFRKDAEVELYFNGVEKLATKTDGVNVVGELEADSLDIDGVADISGDLTVTNNININRSVDGSLVLQSGGASKFLVGYDSSPEGFRVYNYIANEAALFINGADSNATFAGTLTVSGADAITIPDYILHASDDSKFGFPSNDNFKVRLAGSDVFTMNTTVMSFTGEIEGGSLDINGAADISGNTQLGGTLTVGVDDTGHDVKLFGATSGRYLLWDESDDSLNLTDSTQLKIGAAADLRLYHDGSDSYVRGYNHDLIIMQDTADKDIKFKADDGSGGTATYLTLDGGLGWTVASKNIQFSDSIKASFGSSVDMIIQHNGTNSYIENATGNLEIINGQDDGDIIFKSDDGSGGLTAYLTLDGGVGAVYAYKDFKIQDSVYFNFGTSNDFLIGHDGTNTRLYNYTGNMQFINYADDSDILFQCDDGSGGVQTYLTIDGSLEAVTVPDTIYLAAGGGLDLSLRHDGTNSHIQNNTGNLTIKNGSNDSDIIFQNDDGSGGMTAYLTLDGGLGYTTVQKRMKFDDNIQLQFGNGGDLQFYHTGSIGILYNNTGDFRFRQNTNDGDITFECDDGSGGVTAYLTLDGGLGYTVAQKGVKHEGFLWLPDSKYLYVGSGNDLRIHHNGSDSYISQEGTGSLIIRNTTNDEDIIFQSDDGSGGVATYFFLDGSHGGNPVTMFPDNSAVNFGNTLGDLKISHDGSNSTIENNAGALTIKQKTNDGDLVLQCDDGSGGTTAYLTLDGGLGYTTVQKHISFEDDVRAIFGTDNDGSVYVNGGNLYIDQDNNDRDIIFRCDDGSGGTGTYLTLDGSAGTIEVAKEMNLAVSLATDQQKHLAWFEIAGFGTGDGTNYEISVNLDNDTAPFSHNVSIGEDGTTAITVQNIMRSGGTVIPQAGTIKRWKGWATTAGSSTANIALFKITPVRNDNSNVSPVLIDNVSYTAIGNAKMENFEETSFTSASVEAGDIVVTGIKCENTKTTYFSSTLEIEF